MNTRRFAQDVSPPKWLIQKPFAHRGLWNDQFPECSLGAFENSLVHGYPIELDVHVTADGEVVVFHDDELQRMTGVDGSINALNYSEIGGLRLKNSKYHIPLLQEVTNLVRGRVALQIEIKSEITLSEKCCRAVWQVMQHYRGAWVMMSFNPQDLVLFQERAPEILRALLVSPNAAPSIQNNDIRKFEALLKMAKPYAVGFDLWHLVPGELLLKARQKKLVCLGWVVQNKAMQGLAETYLDNFTFENFLPE